MESLKLQNGKYTITNDNVVLKAYRYGEEWRNLSGDNLVYALLQQIDELDEELCVAIDIIKESGGGL